MINQSKEEFISSYISKLLRKNFGKGPQTCRTTLSKNHLVTYIRGFLTPMEEILLQQGKNRYVDDVRAAIINHVMNEITGVVKVTLEVDVEEYYHDWNFPNNSGYLCIRGDNRSGCSSGYRYAKVRIRGWAAQLLS